MNWRESIIGLCGILIGSIITGVSGIVTQNYEDTRKLWTIAYESTLKEWQIRAEYSKGQNIPDFSNILLEHIEHSYVVRKYGADLESLQYAGHILDSMLEKYFSKTDSKDHDLSDRIAKIPHKNTQKKQ